MLTPIASRPEVPAEYGIAPADGGLGLLPWSWADERLRGRHIWWLATTRPDGSPHLMPIWAVWLGDGVAFSTGAATAKARHIARDARVSIVPERGTQSVIVEGVAELLDAARTAEFVAAYKDVWDFDPSGMDSPVFLVRPTRAFGFVDEDNGFTQSATRWDF
ncbi:MAG TPA: pyridoxamine 5'-phosphate oxidase family protein [Acidimicrobiales bacterium]|nr:pyridoxamine 5'-phosphate oxidase family protein [Acidimicrobiales bacterium]